MSTAESRPASETRKRIVIMGVAGCGKSTVGAALGERIGAPYLDGDDLHPETNIAKMSRGEPLTDDDRWPWLTAVGQVFARAEGDMIVGCSSLKRVYRDLIRREAGGPVLFVHLAGSRDLIASRMASRAGHFMPLALLDSQFATLQPPTPDENALSVGLELPVTQLVDTICATLG